MTEPNWPRIGGIYKWSHLTVRVIAIASHVEKPEMYVIYKALNPPEATWARPVDDFVRKFIDQGRGVQ